MEKTAILIDSGYVNAIYHDYIKVKIDYQKMITNLSAKKELLRAYYYFCPPYISDPPTNEEKLRQSSFNKFLYSLHSIPRLTLRQGKLEKRPNGFKQKRVDIMMAVDLVTLSSRNQIQSAIIIAGDSDLIPAIDAAKNNATIIYLYYHSKCVHDELLNACDERISMDYKLWEKWE